MIERRARSKKVGRRKTDIPVVALEQFKEEMKSHVAETIERVVNGNIRGVKNDLAEYIAGDMKWKESMEPIREAFQSTKWSVRAITSTMKFMVLVIPSFAALAWVREHLLNK